VFTDASKTTSALGKLNATVRRVLAKTAAAVLGPLLLDAVIVLAMSIAFAHAGSASGCLGLSIAAVVSLGAFAFLYNWVDVTALSLHPFYKRRLCTAFALKRIKPKGQLAVAQEAIDHQGRLEKEASSAVEQRREVTARVDAEERLREERGSQPPTNDEQRVIEVHKAEV